MGSKVNVLILAGQREGVVDSLCASAGIEWKALLPIHGKPMTEYVLDALSQSKSVKTPYWISGIDKQLVDANLNQSPSEGGPASSVVVAAEAGIPYPFMLTTCDHPLLTAEMVDHFISGAEASDADFALGLAEKTVIQPAYPETKRTYLKFADRSVSGCNLFYVKNAQGLEAIRFWQAAQHDRKKPLKLARRLGIGMLFKYASGRLSLDGAFAHASKMLGISARPVLMPYAEAAIDVDKPSDLTLVETILNRRA
jgi:CTP:molybdopterin cytidylyltransferase MocA